ncbi:MAG: SagB family peptide dehydrogenase [Bryobacterales bacterium]|nr:SagB family peptide dehydrogenase [Bryobacterales bacterium]
MHDGGTLSAENLGYRIPGDHKLRIAGKMACVSGPNGEVRVPIYSGPAGAAAGALSTLPPGEAIAEAELLERVRAAGGDRGVELTQFLQYLARLGALQRVLSSDAGPLAIVEPISSLYELRNAAEPAQEAPLRLSRFSYIRADSGAAVLESPLCHARVRLFDGRLAGMLARLSQPLSINDLRRSDPCMLDGFLKPATALLLAEGFIAAATATGESGVDDSRALESWEFHDLLFHTRSRIGRHNSPVGGTFRFSGKVDPLPAIKPPMSAVKLPLPRPNLTSAALEDMPLTAAIERRRSIRSYSPLPVTLAQFGEFLYRVARVRQRMPAAGLYEVTSRPYPNGGASYELEIYPIVDRCQGLLPGVYHYDPQEHALEPLAGPNTLTEQFLQDTLVFTGQSVRPEILFMIGARFARVSWKYASIAYATILKNVGALYQTMYLVATAMRLAPCALGAGNSDRFTQLLGADYYEETAVGEFILGSLPPISPTG